VRFPNPFLGDITYIDPGPRSHEQRAMGLPNNHDARDRERDIPLVGVPSTFAETSY
jgi:hypothetical protein